MVMLNDFDKDRSSVGDTVNLYGSGHIKGSAAFITAVNALNKSNGVIIFE